MKIKKYVLIVLGFIFLGLGYVGAVMPMIPAFPFLLVSLICFTKSSEKIHNWFTESKIYKNNLEPFLDGKGMTKATKIKVMVIITLIMVVSYIMMKKVIIGRIVLFFVWIGHMLYFAFKVPTKEGIE